MVTKEIRNLSSMILVPLTNIKYQLAYLISIIYF